MGACLIRGQRGGQLEEYRKTVAGAWENRGKVEEVLTVVGKYKRIVEPRKNKGNTTKENEKQNILMLSGKPMVTF